MKRRRAEQIGKDEGEQIDRVLKEKQKRKENRRGKELVERGLVGATTKISLGLLLALIFVTVYGFLLSGILQATGANTLTRLLSALSALLYLPAVLLVEHWYREPFSTLDRNASMRVVLYGLAWGIALTLIAAVAFVVASGAEIRGTIGFNAAVGIHLLSACCTAIGNTILQIYVFRVARRHSDWKKAILVSSIVIAFVSILAQPYFQIQAILLLFFYTFVTSLFYAMTESLGAVILLNVARTVLVGPIFGLSFGAHPMADSLFPVYIGDQVSLLNGGNFALDGALSTIVVYALALGYLGYQLYRVQREERSA